MEIKLPVPMPWTIIGKININKNKNIKIPFEYFADPYNITIPYKKNVNNFTNNISNNKDKSYDYIKISSNTGYTLLLNWFETNIWHILKKKRISIKKLDAFGMWISQAIFIYNKSYPKKTQWNKELWCKIVQAMHIIPYFNKDKRANSSAFALPIE